MMHVQISIRYSDILHEWSWDVSVGKRMAYGYEPTYQDAEGAAREAAKRMGADL